MRILLTNDDGIHADGIRALARVLSKHGHDIVVVAPSEEKSATSHSISVHHAITYAPSVCEGVEAYAVSGSPADCVKVALLHILKGKHPDLIVSGINNGPNLGTDIMYSGTVSAALEGAFLSCRAIAVSLTDWGKKINDYLQVAEYISSNIVSFCQAELPYGTILNINYPANISPLGVVYTQSGVNSYDDYYSFEESDSFKMQLCGEPRGSHLNKGDTDVDWSGKGYITITPLSIDRCDRDTLKRLKNNGLSK